MRLLEFLHKIDEDILLEAAKDRYLQMFQNLPLPGPENIEFADTDKKIAERVQWAMQTFKKSNAITWYLRYYRLFILKSLASKPVEDESQEPWLVQAKKMYAKEVRRLGSKSGLGDSIGGYADTAVMPAEMNKFVHFMSLPIEGIQNYPFEWQTPYDVISDFTRLESDWQESRKGMVPQREEHDVVLQFKDGSAWVNLNTAGCTEEGEAMGHCGNDPTQREGQTVLSYRTQETDDKGRPAWKPHLTFILDTNTGYIGEMKGRNNNPPDKKYHEVIMELLKQPLIKGIIGGGYKPENNFRLSDLTDEQFEYMAELKPELLDPYDQYRSSGNEVTPELVEKLDNMLSDEYEMGFDGYDKEKNVFVLDSNAGDASDIYGKFNEGIDLYISQEMIEEFTLKIMENYLEKDELSALGRYFNSHYPEEDQLPMDASAKEIYLALASESDDVLTGFEDSIKKELQEISVDNAVMEVNSLSDHFYDSEEDNGIYFDEKSYNDFRIVATPEEFLSQGLPKVVAEEGGESWYTMSNAHFLRNPQETMDEELFGEHADEDYQDRVYKTVAETVKKSPEYKEAMMVGENPGRTAEREHGQQRLFASLGLGLDQ